MLSKLPALQRLLIAFGMALISRATELDPTSEEINTDTSALNNLSPKSIHMFLLQIAFSDFQTKLAEIDSDGVAQINEVSSEVSALEKETWKETVTFTA